MEDRYISRYVVCPAHHCPMASQCYRYTNYLEALKKEPVMQVLNDDILEIGDKGCKYLYLSRTVEAAYGIERMYASIPHSSSVDFWRSFPMQCSRRQFYRILHGEVPIMPEQQQDIIEYLSSKGADVTLGFDKYEEVTV